MSHTSTIYVLHFDPPYSARIGGTDRIKVAGHYLGSCAGDPRERLAEHVAGRGSRLVRAAVQAGSKIVLAATMPGGRGDERRLKRRHHHARLCPICSPEAFDA